jgi:hypothetical protein
MVQPFTLAEAMLVTEWSAGDLPVELRGESGDLAVRA